MALKKTRLYSSLRQSFEELCGGMDVSFLMERGWKAPVAPVARLFGGDADDGWFWNEEPPTSVLGRVRILGLAFGGGPERRPPRRPVLARSV